jgi:hypothetical protein
MIGKTRIPSPSLKSVCHKNSGTGAKEVFKARKLKRRYLVFEVNHTVLLVDTSSIGLVNEILPPEGKEEALPALRFRSWSWAEKFLLEGGASRDDLDKTRDLLPKTSLAMLHTWE